MDVTDALDVLVTDAMTGKETGLAKTARTVLRAMERARVPYCVVDAAALAIRGLPRMTRDLDLAVLVDDAPAAWRALRDAGLDAATPTGTDDDPEPMVTFVDPRTQVEVDVLVAAGDPEATAIDAGARATAFGVDAAVARLEHLLLLYLYSNQPKHLGDFAAIVQSGRADLADAEKTLALIHPEMLPEWRRRVTAAKSPPPPPARPRPRPRRSRTRS